MPSNDTNNNNRPFVWNKREQAVQEDCISQMQSVSEEAEVQWCYTNGENFADKCKAFGFKPSDFTVAEFSRWQNRVMDAAVEALVQAERDAFHEMLDARKNKSKGA